MRTEQFEESEPKTSEENWIYGDQKDISIRFWTPFDTAFLATLRALEPYVTAKLNFLEVGFAPGKILAWAALKRGANVSGVDYSESGCLTARRYFERAKVSADIRCENVFDTSLNADTFDVVFSRGVIEHFDEPRLIVKKHVELTKKHGLIIILIPNYSGIWRRIQGKIDPKNLSIHNTDIMSPGALEALFDMDSCSIEKSGYLGPLSLSHLSMNRILPSFVANNLTRAVELLSTLLPFPAHKFAPQVFVIARKTM